MDAVARVLGVASNDPTAILEAVRRLAATNKELAGSADYSHLFEDEAMANVTLILKVQQFDLKETNPSPKVHQRPGGGGRAWV